VKIGITGKSLEEVIDKMSLHNHNLREMSIKCSSENFP